MGSLLLAPKSEWGKFTGYYWAVCYNMSTYNNQGTSMIHRAEHATTTSLPTLTLQLLVVMVVNRLFMLALKPLHQPRIVADILGGVLVGPSVLGGSYIAVKFVIPFRNMLSLETLANLGLVYYMFLVGLELDFKPVIRAGKKALSIALVGIAVCVPLGWALHYYVILKDFPKLSKDRPTQSGPIFWGIALATTNFPDLARILADLKLLHSEIGRIALSAAVISDLCSWFFLMVAMAVVGEDQKWGLVSAVAFIVFCLFVFRPALLRLLRHTTTTTEDKNSYSELHVCLVLSVAVLFGFITDIFGSHSIVGPFVLGAIIPNGELKRILIERIQHFVSVFMMPLFFLTIGVRTNWNYILHEEGPDSKTMYENTSIYRVVGVIIAAFTSKILSTFVIAIMNKLSSRDSLVLGVLMNTKGLLTLIILASAKDLKVLDNRTFAVMMLAVLVMTVPVGPFLAYTYKSTRCSIDYKLRNIQSVGVETELRILTCNHTSSNVSSVIQLLEASNPFTQSPIRIFAVQLVELTGHSSAMLIVNDACKNNSDLHGGNESQFDFNSNNNAFEKYAKQRDNVSVEALTTVSAYNTMHEDICNLAEEKFVNLIITPFHMQATMDGAMEETNPFLKGVNNNVIKNAPCSVGVFVDRGLSVRQITKPHNGTFSTNSHHYAVFFIGGADDREALTYAWRMAGHPRVNLKVIQFIVIPSINKDDANNEIKSPRAMENSRREKQLDDLHLDEFRLKLMHNPSIQYLEETVKSWEETINVISAMEGEHDLYIVGRRHGSTSPTTTFSDYYSDEFDDLGPLGDALASSSSNFNTSILVVQQGAHDLNELEVTNSS